MRVVRSFEPVPADLKGSVIAIGNFDGVHLGHQAVIRREESLARSLGAPIAAMVFEPHPRQFFQPDTPFFRLTPLDQKLELLSALGLDMTAVVAFDADLARLAAAEFVEELLVGWLGIRHAVIGYDFHFGKGRSGSPDTLRSLGDRHGFGVTVVAAAAGEGGTLYSSSRVRELLAAGDVAGAARVLGRFWQVRGPVIGGNKIGTGLGFPTANIALEPGILLRHGIYAARVQVDGMSHDAAAYLGTRPTLDNGRPLLEVFLLDFSGDLYGKVIGIELISHLRNDEAFTSLDALKAQMTKDVAAAREVLAKVKGFRAGSRQKRI